jgi:hypothetical protein
VCAWPLAAQALDNEGHQGWVLSWENDLFARGHTDRWYTNGFHFASARLPHFDEPVKAATSSILGYGGYDQPSISFLLGQNIYTPGKISVSAPQPNDRPWGGYLYVGVGAAEYRNNAHLASDLKVGAIGPGSLARQTQRAVHKATGSTEPLGWDNQLRPRIGAQATYMYTYRFHDFDALPALGVHPFGRVTVGNTKDLATIGLSAIVGEKERVIGAVDEGDFLATDFNRRRNYLPGGWQRWTFYAQVQLARVWRNYFITGPTFGEHGDLMLKHYVATTALGCGFQVTRKLRIDYAVRRRGPEFELSGSSAEDRYQTYGEIRFSVALGEPAH